MKTEFRLVDKTQGGWLWPRVEGVKGPKGAVNLGSATAPSSGRMELIPVRGIGGNAGPNKRTTPAGRTMLGNDTGLGTAYSAPGGSSIHMYKYSLCNLAAWHGVCVERRVRITAPLACLRPSAGAGL